MTCFDLFVSINQNYLVNIYVFIKKSWKTGATFMSQSEDRGKMGVENMVLECDGSILPEIFIFPPSVVEEKKRIKMAN